MNYSDPTLDLRIEQVINNLPLSLQNPAVINIMQLSLAEDLHPEADFEKLWPHLAEGDATSFSTLPSDCWLEGKISTKADGVIAGLPIIQALCLLMDPQIACKPIISEGEYVSAGTLIVEVSGPGIALLAVERPMLNFLGRMSGIATLTHKYMKAISGTNTVVLDTRKTSPGLRRLDKYAVHVGGGQNHRMGLFDMIMIKDNHIDGAGSMEAAVLRVRQQFGSKYRIEVKVKDLDELRTALELNVDQIMLDNMDLETMRHAVNIVNRKIPLEASGNVTLKNIAEIAKTGVDYISSGALTHSTPVLDISMRLR